MTPEGKVKAKVKRVLEKYNVYYFMPVQTGMGKRTLDFLGCVGGNFFAIETKAPGQVPTKFQEKIIEEMENVLADVFVIDNVECPEMTRLEAYLAAFQQDIPTRIPAS